MLDALLWFESALKIWYNTSKKNAGGTAMEEQNNPAIRNNTGMWVLVLVCMAAVIFALTSGAAYTGISAARLSAAKASAGQIESVFLLAEVAAAETGLRPEEGTVKNVLKSYEDGSGAVLSEYEQYLLDYMMASFGPQRDFDFSVERYEDGSGVHLQIQFFPVKGRTNTGGDRYYMALDGVITEKNGL